MVSSVQEVYAVSDNAIGKTFACSFKFAYLWARQPHLGLMVIFLRFRFRQTLLNIDRSDSVHCYQCGLMKWCVVVFRDAAEYIMICMHMHDISPRVPVRNPFSGFCCRATVRGRSISIPHTSQTFGTRWCQRRRHRFVGLRQSTSSTEAGSHKYGHIQRPSSGPPQTSPLRRTSERNQRKR